MNLGLIPPVVAIGGLNPTDPPTGPLIGGAFVGLEGYELLSTEFEVRSSEMICLEVILPYNKLFLVASNLGP
jgi:hypothetical protein